MQATVRHGFAVALLGFAPIASGIITTGLDKPCGRGGCFPPAQALGWVVPGPVFASEALVQAFPYSPSRVRTGKGPTWQLVGADPRSGAGPASKSGANGGERPW